MHAPLPKELPTQRLLDDTNHSNFDNPMTRTISTAAKYCNRIKKSKHSNARQSKTHLGPIFFIKFKELRLSKNTGWNFQMI